MGMADSGKSKPAIPAWQRTQKPLASGGRSPSQDNSSQGPTDGSSIAAKQEFEASKTTPQVDRPTEDVSSVDHSKTDGSNVAAKQEFEASKVTSQVDQPPERVSSVDHSKTDGSDVAAKQEHDASKATPAHLQEAETPSRNSAASDGSDEAAKQEYGASLQVIDHVRKFLSDPQVKDASMDKKRTFLESKGVSKEIITQVLEVGPTSTTFDTADFQRTHQAPKPQPLSQPRRDLPPIVTYPEFLMQPQRPPPLVTVDRLLNAAYITGGITATLYGLSQFVISPMSATLSEARHDLATHTSKHLDAINDKLSGIVSTVPAATRTRPGTADVDEVDDSDSIVSDPTELFHRDIGTQTSPLPSPGETSTSAPSSETQTTLSKQEARFRILQSHLDDFLADSETNNYTNTDIRNEVAELRQQVDSMVYTPPAYQYMPGDTVFTPPGTPGSRRNDDAFKNFKAEIRGVKGVLLSAKRFPSVATYR